MQSYAYFVSVKVEGLRAKTFVVKAANYVGLVFNEQMVFPLRKPESSLTVRVYQKNMIGQKLVGVADIDLGRFSQAGSNKAVSMAHMISLKGIRTGEILMEFMWTEGFEGQFKKPKPTAFAKGLTRKNLR